MAKRKKGKTPAYLKEFVGKTVAGIEEWLHGTYGYNGYVVRFTDGTYLRLRGNSLCDIEAYPSSADPYDHEEK